MPIGTPFEIVDYPSPNCGERRDDMHPDMVVLHYTAMKTACSALERLCDPMFEVSAHYLISEHGQIWQMVPEKMRAWHAGAGQWGDVCDVNSRSIGIELANRGNHPFPEAQMAALETLLAGIMERWDIAPERIIGHSDMAPLRKFDPGARFDWRRLALGGLSVWPDFGCSRENRDTDFIADAGRFGYALPIGVENPEDELLRAFRLRFRSWTCGPIDDVDRSVMANLADRFPVS